MWSSCATGGIRMWCILAVLKRSLDGDDLLTFHWGTKVTEERSEIIPRSPYDHIGNDRGLNKLTPMNGTPNVSSCQEVKQTWKSAVTVYKNNPSSRFPSPSNRGQRHQSIFKCLAAENDPFPAAPSLLFVDNRSGSHLLITGRGALRRALRRALLCGLGVLP